MSKIRIIYSDFTESICDNPEEAERDILEAFAEGVTPDLIQNDEDEDLIYSCNWSVKLQKEC